MDVERIKFERTGGFTGMTITRDLKLEDLPEDQVERLQELLDDLDFDELSERTADARPMPDQFQYVITLETKDGEHTLVTGDGSAPEKMQELLKLLNRLVRIRKKH
jgi:hypothetical protein